MEIFDLFERSASQSKKIKNTTLTPGRLEESEELPLSATERQRWRFRRGKP